MNIICLKRFSNNFFKKAFTFNTPIRRFSEEPPKFKTNLINDYNTAKKQVFWRIRNIGQLELEYIVMKWYDKQEMSLEELKGFSEEVLEMENPDMNKYFVKMVPAAEHLVYTRKIQHFILNQ